MVVIVLTNLSPWTIMVIKAYATTAVEYFEKFCRSHRTAHLVSASNAALKISYQIRWVSRNGNKTYTLTFCKTSTDEKLHSSFITRSVEWPETVLNVSFRRIMLCLPFMCE